MPARMLAHAHWAHVYQDVAWVHSCGSCMHYTLHVFWTSTCTMQTCNQMLHHTSDKEHVCQHCLYLDWKDQCPLSPFGTFFMCIEWFVFLTGLEYKATEPYDSQALGLLKFCRTCFSHPFLSCQMCCHLWQGSPRTSTKEGAQLH